MQSKKQIVLLSCLFLLSATSARAEFTFDASTSSIPRTTASLEASTGNKPVARELELEATISFSQFEAKLSGQIDNLLEQALKKNPQMANLDNLVKHHRKLSQRTMAQAKDAGQFLFCYQGFAPSSEAADLILNEKLKLNNRSAVEYARQRVIDDNHLAIFKATMQIARGLGDAQSERAKQTIASGTEKLKALVGEEEAIKTVDMMTSWNRRLEIPESAYAAPIWDIDEQSAKLQIATTGAKESDAVVEGVRKNLNKYNHKSAFSRASGRVIETILGTATLAPNVIGPAAQVAMISFQLGTGGTEQAKMTKSIYLGKRQESRLSVINEEAHLALTNYQLAVAMRNKTLLAFTQLTLQKISGKKAAQEIFGSTVLLGYGLNLPELPESTSVKPAANTSHLPVEKNNG